MQADPYLSGNFAPILSEDDFALTVRGEIPAFLSGVFYRNGPNPRFAPRDGVYHWFTGDGMIHAFAIADGAVSYRNRWVRTHRWQAENEAGESLFGIWGNPVTSHPSVVGTDSGVANTNIVHHANRLLALEEAHAPFELAPWTLAPRGAVALGGRVTAHPKIDPKTGEMIFFAYGDGDIPLNPTIAWGVANADGTLQRRETFEAPYCSMVHDFAVTEHYVIIPVLPLVGDLPRAMAGGPPFAWEPQRAAQIAVLHRGQGVASLRWFPIEACYVFHVMNAYEEGGDIVVDVLRHDRAPLFPSLDGEVGPNGPTRLTRWRLSLAEGGVKAAPLAEASGEFPRFDERLAGLPYTNGWIVGAVREGGGAQRLTHVNVGTGAAEHFTVPEGDSLGEAIFVPASAQAAEAEGCLLTIAYRGEDDSSELLFLDPLNVAEGPFASATLPRRVPNGFHGNWVSSASTR
jgi:carotenoid cleavage dioxygenase